MKGIRRIEVSYGDRNVGFVSQTGDGLCVFEYSGEWLDSGFSVSPFELPLRKEVFIARRNPFEGGFGVFDDCLPDGWGLKWKFAPAYDLLPSDGINGYRTTSINDSIVPDKKDLLAVAIKAGLGRQEADTVYNGMKSVVDGSMP